MTVWIYTDTNKQVGDVDHLKVQADALNRQNRTTGISGITP
jgi:hypothetical protein